MNDPRDLVLRMIGTPVLLIDADGAVRWFNDACRREHGWHADVVGKSFLDVFPQLTGFDLDLIQGTLAREDRWAGRLTLSRSDGATYPGLVTIVPVYDDDRALTHVVATSTDLTEVDVLQRKLIAGFDNSPNGWAFTDLDGAITECNPVFCEIVGRSRADVVGRMPGELTHPADREKRTPFEEMRNRALPPTFGTQKRYLRPDGSARWVDLQVELVLDHRGDPHFFSGHSTDITSLVESLREGERLSRSYQELFGHGVTSIGRALELRDPYTAGHESRVAALSDAIGARLGLDGDEREGLRVAAELHDLGKIGTPAEILAKPRRLDAAEYAIIQRHADAGADILESMPFPWPVARAVREHHERIDGSGYPSGLVDGDIGIEALILAVADTIEVVASHRPYRPARPLDDALEIVNSAAGTLFDRDVARAAISLFRDGFTIPSPKG